MKKDNLYFFSYSADFLGEALLFFDFSLFCFSFLDTVSLCGLDWPRTQLPSQRFTCLCLSRTIKGMCFHAWLDWFLLDIYTKFEKQYLEKNRLSQELCNFRSTQPLCKGHIRHNKCFALSTSLQPHEWYPHFNLSVTL